LLFNQFFFFFRALNLFVLNIDSEIRIRLNLSNILSGPNRRKADPAFGAKIDVYYPTSFVQYTQAILDDISYSCQPIIRTHVLCKMTDAFNNPFPPEKQSIIELVFTLSNVSLSNILRFYFNSSTLTNETNLENNNVTLIAKVLLKTDLNLTAQHEPEQVSISGEETVGLSSIKTIEQFGMEVTHVYTVKNSGPNNVRSHNVTIYWPYETLDDQWENGKILLYLVDEPIIEFSPTLSSTGTKVDGHCERWSQWRDHIHILESLDRTSTINRKRREEQNIENIADPKSPIPITPSPSLPIIRSLTLTCDPTYQNVRCYPIYCHIKSLSAQNYYSIKIRARLWTSTLIENYFNKYDRVEIQSYASIHINDLLIFQTSTHNDNATATTPAEFATRSDVIPRLPLWVPLVGAMAGLILLVFIVIVCCLVC
jgi:integrin alpha 7